MKFTAHNILLDDGTKTLRDDQILLGDSAVWKSIEKTTNLFINKSTEERKSLRVVDLGCLEGGYAVQFARMGFDTLGIDARKENIDNCNYVKSKLNLPNLNFAQDDVRNLHNYGKFDIVLCYGLLYHLNDPVNFLQTIGACTNKLLFLNTHFAPEHDARYSLGLINNLLIGPIQKRTGLFVRHRNYRLSKIAIHEGYKGRWYKEWNNTTNKEKIEKMLWASYNNDRSFWLCKKDLTKAIQASGFNSLFEQFDFTGDLFPDNYTEFYNRTMFVGVKH
ncbi:MAG TPA: methyltransferase domain-containing protein [Niabella sp.]|nr:methyltransferase domain-containing protein [Niabella sp.]